MKANIYIGLGGSGIKTVDSIKQQVFSSENSHNDASAFCAIDTDFVSLDNCKVLSSSEFLNINIEFPNERYIINEEGYDIPNKNIGFLKSLGSWGSGAIRSNGHICFLFNKDIIKKTILRAYDKLICVKLTEEYRCIDSIDVHLFFSLCGGTGSGIFYDIAKLVKEIIPNSNIICYAYSHNHFMNIGINWNIALNTYAALLETDYSFNIAYYQNPSYNPFCKFIYIDNQYFSDGFYDKVVLPPQNEVLCNEIIHNVAKSVTKSVKYDIPIGDKPRYNKWVSSIGFTELLTNDLCGEIDIKELGYRIRLALRKASPFMDTKDCRESLRFKEFHSPTTYVITHDTNEDIMTLFRESYLGEGTNFVHPSWSERGKIVIIRSLSATELSHVVGIDELDKLFKYYIKKGFQYSPFTTMDLESNLASNII